ncbi:hypothetical protein D3C77_656830 [compost metagenome]
MIPVPIVIIVDKAIAKLIKKLAVPIAATGPLPNFPTQIISTRPYVVDIKLVAIMGSVNFIKVGIIGPWVKSFMPFM